MRRILALIGVLTLVATACSGDDSATPETVTVTSIVTETVTETSIVTETIEAQEITHKVLDHIQQICFVQDLGVFHHRVDFPW